MLSLPIWTFWELARNVDRIRAGEDKRFFQVIQHSIMGEPQKFFDHLQKEQGRVFDSERIVKTDHEGLTRLKHLIV